MFNDPHNALYKFRFDGITYYVIEDDPRNSYLRVRSVHGSFDFPKDELQKMIEEGKADIGCDDKLLGLKH